MTRTSKIKAKRNFALAVFLIVGLVLTLSGTTGTAGKLTTFLNLPGSMTLLPSGAVFGDDFETGNIYAWDYYSFSPIIQSSVTYSGSYALDGGNGFLYKDLVSGYNDLFVSFYVYFTAIPTNSWFGVCSVWDSSFSNDVTVTINTFGSSAWSLNMNNDNSQTPYYATIQTGRLYWVQVERNSGAGVANLWIDGVQVASASGVLNTAGSIFAIGGSGVGSTIYDDVVASPSYIAFIPPSTPAPSATSTPIPTPTPIGATPTPTPSPTPYITPTPTPTPTASPVPTPTPIPQVSLNMGTSGSGSIYPASGTHAYNVNSDVSISATASYGYSFSYWLFDDATKSYVSATSLLMSRSRSALAVFTQDVVPTPTPAPGVTPNPIVSPLPTPLSTIQPTPLPTSPPIIVDDNLPQDLKPINGGNQPYINTNELATVGGLSTITVVCLGLALNNGVFGKKR
jgi:hypothetical protein